MQRTETYVTSVQERQLLALAPLMEDEPLVPMRITHGEEPLEKTRMYGPFGLEVMAFVKRMGALVVMGWDAEGREYIEY